MDGTWGLCYIILTLLELNQPARSSFSAEVYDSPYKSAACPCEWLGMVR